MLESRILFPLFGCYALAEDNSKPLLYTSPFYGVLII